MPLAAGAPPAVAAVPAVPARDAIPAGEWGLCTAAESADVMVIPNYFGWVFSSFGVYHYNDHLKCHDESQDVPYHLETAKYWAMEKKLKQYLCQEPCHPGNCIPTTVNGYSFDNDSEWRKIAAHLFTGRNLKFQYMPLDLWPLFQGTNHMLSAKYKPRCVPIDHTGRLLIRAKLKDSFDGMFLKRNGVNKDYRFNILKMTLVVEQVRLNPTLEARLFGKGKPLLAYPGISKLSRAENLANGIFQHTTRFESVYFPEFIYVFALPKTVIAGTHTFAAHTVGSPFFLQHNISRVRINFAGHNVHAEEPHFGNVDNDMTECHALQDYHRFGLFGMKVNKEVVTRASIKNGFVGAPFPHVYLCLMPEEDGSRARIVPPNATSAIYDKPADLDITFKFSDTGSAADANYLVYLAYTDINMVYDQTEKKFYSAYGIH